MRGGKLTGSKKESSFNSFPHLTLAAVSGTVKTFRAGHETIDFAVVYEFGHSATMMTRIIMIQVLCLDLTIFLNFEAAIPQPMERF